MGGFVWVTLATNDSYSLGALVLAHSLKKVGTAHKLAVLITPAVSPAMRDQLGTVYDVVKVVDVLDSKDEANLALLKRPELGITFTKLHCWQLTEFEKGVFLDADTLVVRNCDELFDREEFSAAPDVGWPDCFNSGVFVFRPAVETFNQLIQFAVEKGSFDGGDQGLLNQFFSTWATDDIKKHLPFVYNLTSVAVYSYRPAFKQYGSDTRIVHFIGPVKPWLQQVDPSSKVVTPTPDSEHLQPLLQQWWDLFIEKVHPGLSTSLDCDIGLLPFFALLTCSTDPLDSTLARSDPPPQPLEPSFPEPYTPYIEKDDERQYNLPYQPFQVVSSEGELLNITFSDFARDNDLKESEVTEFDHVEPMPDYVEPEVEEEVENEQSEEQPPQEQPVYKHNYVEDNQFNYHNFVPDESCIQAYLEHNVQEYQPGDYGNWVPPHEHQESTHWEPPALPRFLTIPQDDQRQSNQAYVREASPDRYWSNEEQQQWVPWELPAEQNIAPTYEPIPRAPSPVHQTNDHDHIISRSKSMSNLIIDATNATSFENLTAWKSQPEVSIETPKKLPGLKPLIPKDNTPIKSKTKPKYTESTEVHMINTWSDPLGPPVDTIGFVERAIMKRTQSQKNLFDIPQGALEPNIPVITSVPILPMYVPQEMNEYVDLLDCKRQAGNKPVQKGTELKPEKEEKLPRRRSKRSVRRAADKWKPPETVEATYDVDSVMKRLSELSSGYTPPTLPEENKVPVHDFTKYRDFVAGRAEISNQGLGSFDNLVSNGNIETAADRLFRDSMDQLEEKSKNVFNKNVVSHSSRFIPVTMKGSKKKSKKDKKGLTILKPFAALPGESLSEMDSSVPEIVVCVASPEDEEVDHSNKTSTPIKAFDETYILDSDGNSFKSPFSEQANSVVSLFESIASTSDGGIANNGSVASDDTFKSAISNFSPEVERKTNNLIQSGKILKSQAVELNDVEKDDSIIQRLSKLEINEEILGLKPNLSAIVEETFEAENTIILDSYKSEEPRKLKNISEIKLLDFAGRSVPVTSNDLSPIYNVVTQTSSLREKNSVLTKVSAASKKGDTPIVSITKQLEDFSLNRNDMEKNEASEPKIEKLVKKELFSNPPEVIEPNELNITSKETTLGEKDNIESISFEIVGNKDEAVIVPVSKQLEVLSLNQNVAPVSIEEFVNKDLFSDPPEVQELTDYHSKTEKSTLNAIVDITSCPVVEKLVEELLSQPLEGHESTNYNNTETNESVLNKNANLKNSSSTSEESKDVETINVPNLMQQELSSNRNVPKENETEGRSFSPPGVIEVSTNFKVVNTPDLNKSIEVEIAEDSLKFDFDKLVSDVVAFGNLETSSPSEVTKPVFKIPGNGTKAPVLSYASAAKKESSEVPNIESSPSTSSKPTTPKPTQSNGVKPKKTLKPKAKPVATSSQQSAIIQPTKVVKRKAEKMEVEYPSNRFELLPKEIDEGNDDHKKKVKKVIKCYLNPSTSNSLPPPLTESIVEEDTQLYLGEPDDNPGIAGAIAQLNLDSNPSVPSGECSAAQAEYLRRQSWETGKMDYMGRDSFANVLSKINETLSQQPIAEDLPFSSESPHAEYHPVSLSMILDCESIETLPADIMTLPVEAADDDIIFNRQTDSNVGLPEIKEEVEEPDEEQVEKIQVIEEKSSEKDDSVPSELPQKIVIFTTPPTPLEESVKILSLETFLPVKETFTSSVILKSDEQLDQKSSGVEDNLVLGEVSSLTEAKKELKEVVSPDEPETVIKEEVLQEFPVSDFNFSASKEVENSEFSMTETGSLIKIDAAPNDKPSAGEFDDIATKVPLAESENLAKELTNDNSTTDENSKSSLIEVEDVAAKVPLAVSENLAIEISIDNSTADDNTKPSLIEVKDIGAKVTFSDEFDNFNKEISNDNSKAENSKSLLVEVDVIGVKTTLADESGNLATDISNDNTTENLKSSVMEVQGIGTKVPMAQYENLAKEISNDNSTADESLESSLAEVEHIGVKVPLAESENLAKEVSTDNSTADESLKSSLAEVEHIGVKVPLAESENLAKEVSTDNSTTDENPKSLLMELEDVGVDDESSKLDQTVVEKATSAKEEENKIKAETSNANLTSSKSSTTVNEKAEIQTEILSNDRLLSDNDSEIKKTEIDSTILSLHDKTADSNLSVELESSETDQSIEKLKITQTPSNSPSLDFQECLPANSDISQSDVIRDSPLPLIGSESSSAFAAYKPIATKEKNIVEPTPVKRQSSTEESKEKKGVFTKILEFVGVVKKKEEAETSTAVFYDEVFESKPEEISTGGVEGIQNILKATDLGTIEEGEVSKKRSPSPRINIPKVPHTHITAATPPTTPAQKPLRADPEALAVDLTILETPPVVEKKTSILEETEPVLDRKEIITEIDNIIEKAKLIAEDQLDSYDPLYAKVIKKASRMGMTENQKPPIALCEDFEELKVTKNEDRKRPKDNVTSSKLAGQILKAIPPPRRRPISDSKSSPEPENTEQKEIPENVSESAPKPPPVPPRRNRSRQRTEPQAPPKRKPKN